MSDNFSKWLGGPDFIRAQQWGVGRTNSGEGRKKFGHAGAKRGANIRFNPNPTRSSHPGCTIAIQSRVDKDRHIEMMRQRAA